MTITTITQTATGSATGTATAKLNNRQTLISSSIPTKECCSNCGAAAAPLLHHVRIRDTPRRLCTSCVLRLHPASFCPVCLAFYGDSLPHPSKRISCASCSCLAHSHCAGVGGGGDPFLSSSYLCPPCKDPSFSFFPLKENNNKIDKKLAVALLCAAKIASASLTKAVAKARAHAHERAREAALARKRAREAVEHLLHVTQKEKAARKGEGLATDMDVDVVDNADADGDVDADADELVRQLEDSLVKDEDD